MPLVSKEGLLYLECIGKPANEDLVNYPSVHQTSTHPWDPTMLDAPSPYHSLSTDGGKHGSPNGPSEGSQPKQYQQESLIASSDPDVIKIHLQSSLCLNLTPMINHIVYFSHHQKRMGSRSPRMVTKF